MSTETIIARLQDVRCHLTRGAVGIPDAETILDEILAALQPAHSAHFAPSDQEVPR
jgi:hypothetical protein